MLVSPTTAGFNSVDELVPIRNAVSPTASITPTRQGSYGEQLATTSQSNGVKTSLYPSSSCEIVPGGCWVALLVTFSTSIRPDSGVASQGAIKVGVAARLNDSVG